MAYIGNGLEDASVNKYEYTATAGQTTFNCVYDNQVDVYLNGVLLSATDYTATSGVNIVLGTGATAGDIIQIDGFQTAGASELPSQTGNADKYLKTNGTLASWADVDSLPDQTGHTDQYLKSNGTVADWADVVGGGPSLGTDSIIRTNSQTISENITIPADTNGMSIGDITIADTYTVTVNGRWVII